MSYLIRGIPINTKDENEVKKVNEDQEQIEKQLSGVEVVEEEEEQSGEGNVMAGLVKLVFIIMVGVAIVIALWKTLKMMI